MRFQQLLRKRAWPGRAAAGIGVATCVSGAGFLFLYEPDETLDLSKLSQRQLLQRSLPFDPARFERIAFEARRAALFHNASGKAAEVAAIRRWHDENCGGAVTFLDKAPLATYVYTSEDERSLFDALVTNLAGENRSRRQQVVVRVGKG